MPCGFLFAINTKQSSKQMISEVDIENIAKRDGKVEQEAVSFQGRLTDCSVISFCAAGCVSSSAAGYGDISMPALILTLTNHYLGCAP